jgi:hypothetical protein
MIIYLVAYVVISKNENTYIELLRDHFWTKCKILFGPSSVVISYDYCVMT